MASSISVYEVQGAEMSCLNNPVRDVWLYAVNVRDDNFTKGLRLKNVDGDLYVGTPEGLRRIGDVSLDALGRSTFDVNDGLAAILLDPKTSKLRSSISARGIYYKLERVYEGRVETAVIAQDLLFAAQV